MKVMPPRNLVRLICRLRKKSQCTDLRSCPRLRISGLRGIYNKHPVISCPFGQRCKDHGFFTAEKSQVHASSATRVEPPPCKDVCRLGKDIQGYCTIRRIAFCRNDHPEMCRHCLYRLCRHILYQPFAGCPEATGGGGFQD